MHIGIQQITSESPGILQIASTETDILIKLYLFAL